MILQSNKLHNKRFLSFTVYQYYPQYRNIDYTYRNFSFSGSAAIGTPLSNSVTELHTMMRYLEYDFLASRNLQNFDNWITVVTHPKGQPFYD